MRYIVKNVNKDAVCPIDKGKREKLSNHSGQATYIFLRLDILLCYNYVINGRHN